MPPFTLHSAETAPVAAKPILDTVQRGFTADPTTMASFFPSLDRKILIALALSGVAATIAFDVFGQILSPAAGFVELAPVGMANLSRKLSSNFTTSRLSCCL